MKEDPVVAEVRKVRDAHAARFGYDIDAIAQDFKQREGKDQQPVVSLTPKRVTPQRASR